MYKIKNAAGEYLSLTNTFTPDISLALVFDTWDGVQAELALLGEGYTTEPTSPPQAPPTGTGRPDDRHPAGQ